MSMSLSAKVLDELRGRYASCKRVAETSRHYPAGERARRVADDTFRQMQIVAAWIIGRGVS